MRHLDHQLEPAFVLVGAVFAAVLWVACRRDALADALSSLRESGRLRRANGRRAGKSVVGGPVD